MGLTLLLGAAEAPAAEPSVILGANTTGITSNTAPALDSFADRAGVMPGIAMYYQDWNEGWSTAILNPRFIDPMVARGATPMVSWAPMLDTSDPVHQPAYSPARVAAGDYDAYVRRAAREVAAFARPLYIRLAWEMNGKWSPWGGGVDGNTAADYIAMWRHVVTIFRQEGASNAIWVWAPNVYGFNSVAPFEPFYPGDAWVDYVGLDGYNWGSSRGGRWYSFRETFDTSYAALRALTSKPVMITEVGSAEVGGDKSAWIGQIASVLADMPAVRALVWFDRNKETDWRIDSSPEALSSFRATVAKPPFVAPSVSVEPEDPVDNEISPSAAPAPALAGPPSAAAAGTPVVARLCRRTIREGGEGIERTWLPVRLARPVKGATRIRYRLRGRSAQAPGDFRAKSGVVTVSTGSKRGRIPVWINGDHRSEGNEMFEVRLGPTDPASGSSRAMVQIRDDD